MDPRGPAGLNKLSPYKRIPIKEFLQKTPYWLNPYTI